MKEYIQYYYDCWITQNKIYYNPQKQKEILQWLYWKLKEEIENGVEYNLKKFITQHLINEVIAINVYMAKWIRCVKEIIMNNNKSKRKDNVRKFFITKRKNRKRIEREYESDSDTIYE